MKSFNPITNACMIYHYKNRKRTKISKNDRRRSVYRPSNACIVIQNKHMAACMAQICTPTYVPPLRQISVRWWPSRRPVCADGRPPVTARPARSPEADRISFSLSASLRLDLEGTRLETLGEKIGRLLSNIA